MATAGPALVFEAAEQGSVVMAQLAGVINEDNLLEERLTATKGKGVLIDLANVERINSCGVRDWIRFAQRLEAAGNNLYLLRCSPVVVAQLNMVRNFCGEKGQVLSFQAPYFCPNCDEERTETFPASNVAAGTSPDATCPTCKGPMEFDDLPDLYFAFAKIHGQRSVPPEIQTAMQNFRSRPTSTPNPMAPGSRPAMPAMAPPAAPRPMISVPAVAVGARPASNPGLQPPKPPTPSIPTAQLRPSNPALRPQNPATPSPPMPGANQAARRPSSPGTPPPAQASGSNPAMQSRGIGTSGPKPPVAARPLMGGSPFPSASASQRASGPKPAMPMAPNGATDPSKKS
jgi:anti-anti-sigma regulatory factor